MTTATADSCVFSVEARHDYFGGAAWRGVDLVAAAETATLLDRLGCIVRPLVAGVSVHAGPRTASIFAMARTLPDALERLSFVASTRDDGFPRITANLPSDPRAMPHLRSEYAGPEVTGLGSRLHPGERVTAADAESVDSPPLQSIVEVHQGLLPPPFAVSVHVQSFAQALAARVARRYYLRFAARATVWNYLFVGDWDDDLRVVDLAGEVSFEPARALAAGIGAARVVAVRSSAPIELGSRHQGRFQLQQGRGETRRVLIKRLPVASPSRFDNEAPGPHADLISEIHVNR